MTLRTALVILATLAAAWLATMGAPEPGGGQAPSGEPVSTGTPAATIARTTGEEPAAPVPAAGVGTAVPPLAFATTPPAAAAPADLPAGFRLSAPSLASPKSPPSTLRDYEQRREGAARFLAALYRDFTGSEGDAQAIALWADLIAAGTLTREQAVEHFLDSAPQLEGAAPLARLYLAFFQRVPDEAGWRHWRALFAGGRTLEDIGDSFAASREFAARFGGLDDGAFVDFAFRNTLGRDPTSLERAEWRSQLATGLATRGRVMLSLSESPEFREAVANQVDASLLYSGLLGRTGDAPGLAAWMRTMQEQARTRSWMIAGFLDSAEYRARIGAGEPGK